ncbi:protein TOPAZ1 [Heteronotia binoei]|uniref:protein TOPAZ1 n=1 Tax=Heteronotia binoei TaxID=13085 RepID=UPI00292D2D8D|nr:protein TOPAZ1 [Heteronotia binoei]
MVQKTRKSKQEHGSAFKGCPKDQALLEQPTDLTEPLAPNSEGSSEAKEKEQNKWLFSERRKRTSCGKCVSVVLDYKAEINFAVDTNLKEDENLVEDSCSKKAAQSMGKQQHCAASKTTLQKKFASCLRLKRRSSLSEPQEEGQALQQNYKRCSLELAQTKSCEDLQALKQDRCLLENVGCLKDRKKFRSIAKEGRHRMVTRALLKSKICKNDSDKLDWKQEKSVAMEIPWYRIRTLEKQMARGQIVDSAPTEGQLIARVTGCSEKCGKDEIVPELKIKIKSSREQKTEVSDIHCEKLPEIDLNASQNCNIPKLLVESTCLQITKLDETEHKEPVRCCLGREAAIPCDESSLPVTNSKCSQLWDIKISGNKVEKDTLVVYQDDKLRYLTKLNDFPCRVRKNPVVTLLDCSYIKALLNPTSNQTFQNYKLHCKCLHVAESQRKDLSPNQGMEQNDLNHSSNIVQARQSFFQTNILIGKGMCQNRKMSQRCQNGKKRFSKWCLKNSKKVKMTEDLKRSTIQEVLSNMELYNEYRIQIDENAIADPSVITEELKYNKSVSLPSLDVPDFLLKRDAQEHPNELVTLSGNKQKSISHFASYNASDFENSDLQKENYVTESKTMEPHTDFSDFEKSELHKENDTPESETVEPHTNFSRAKDDYEQITNCSNNIVGYMQSEKAAPKGKTVSKTGKILEFSCQRIVPFSGKNIWPRESCARTSLWFCKDHVSGSEFLTGTDSFANTVQMELHKLLVDTSTVPANKEVDCETDHSIKSPAPESQPDIPKTFSDVGNKNGISSTDMERPKHCPSRMTKNAKKYKMSSNSPAKDTKNEESMVRRNISTGMFADRSKNKTKSLVSKQETAIPQVLKTLSMGDLSKYRIPLLKDKSVLRKERNCNSQSIIDLSAASVKKDRSKRVSSEFEHLFHSEQINGISMAAVEEHADQFDSSVSGSFPRENSVCNKDLTTFLESDVESSTLKDISNSLSIGCTKKPTEIPVSSEVNENNWSNTLAQGKDKFCADVLKAYEDDALVIDVIQDDPDLFGNTDELEATGSKEHVNDKYCSITTLSGNKLEKPLPRSNLAKFRPKESPIQVHDTLRLTTDGSASLPEGDKTKSYFFSRKGTTELSFKDGQLTELEDLSRCSDLDVKNNFSEEITAVKEKADVLEAEKIENTEHQHVNLDKHEFPLPSVKAVVSQRQGTVVKPWMNDFRFSWKGPLVPSTYLNSCGSLQVEKNTGTCFGLILPHRYCRLHFNSLNGCGRPKCWYAHVPEAGDAKLCSEIIKKYISIGEIVLLKRAVQIFTDYYKDVTRGLQLDLQMLNDLLISLLQCCWLKELFHVLHTCLLIKVQPTIDVLLKVFEHVASLKLKEVVPELIDISSKFIDGGMVLDYEHLGYITKFLNQLQVSSQEITTFMSRFQTRHFYKPGICDFSSAVAEFQHCKEKGDWAKLGVVYIHVRRGCENFDDLEKYSLFVADILISAVKEDRPGVPFCEFAAAVNAEPRHNEADKALLGRIGISVLYAYYKIHQWLKARKVLDIFHALQIHFTYLKGLIGPEQSAPRCEIVNVAVEVFLNSGSLDGAVWILKESEWVINTLSWPCDRMDVLNRHNLLCKIASEYITKNRYREAFEVLRNLPGFQNSCGSLDVSQYSLLFNKLLGASSESKSLAISSAVIDFMLAKNIPVDFQLLRAFITALGRSSLWLKARTYYKSALALGCYPPLEGNLYRKLLLIPSYITEIEMLLAIEVFLVSNASSIQSPGASNQILQIVLKRCEGNSVRNKDDYQSAVERLIQATQLATPKLFLKHLTVNVNQEQVYSLEHAWVLKWLKENMKWAGKVWLFQ